VPTATTRSLGLPIIYTPENDPTTPIKFTSVMLWLSTQNSSSAATSITRISASIQLSGSATSSQNTGASTLTNSAEDIAGIFGPFDYTNYFTQSYGTVTSKTASVSISPILTAAGAALTGSYGWVDLTYEYSSSATRRIKTVCFPYESLTSTLPTTLTTTFASSSQITGSGGLLDGYANPVVRYRWLEVKGNCNNAATATNYSMSYSFNGGASTTLPAKTNNQASDTWQTYLIDMSSLSLTTSHSFQLANNLSTRWANVIVNEWITFEYDVAGTTRALNYVEFPIEFNSPIGGTTAASNARYSKEIIIPEPGSIQTLNCAVELNYTSNANSNTLNVKGGNQTSYRAYANAGNVICGQFGLQQRLDTGSASAPGGIVLKNGVNTINVDAYRSAGTVASLTGVAKLLYKSDVSPLGIDTHNKTVYGFFRPISFTLTGDDQTTDFFQTPEPDYYINSIGLQYHLWFSVAASGQYTPMLLQARRGTGEGPGSGWETMYEDNFVSDSELSYMTWSTRTGNYFDRYPQNPFSDKLALSSSRIYRTTTSGTTVGFGTKWIIQYHTMTGSISGTISNSSGGTVNLNLYQQVSGSNNYDLFASSSRTGNGSYSFTTYNDFNNYYVAAYESSTLKGLSKSAVPGSGFDIDLAGGGGGGGEFFF